MTDEEINEIFDEFLEKKQEEKKEYAEAAMQAAFDAKLKPRQDEAPKPVKPFRPSENRALIRAILEDFVRCGKVSVSQIQRRFCKGYLTAIQIMEFLEIKKFIVTDKYGNKAVALTPYEIYRICPDGSGD